MGKSKQQEKEQAKKPKSRGILIRVTAEDIEKGVPHWDAHCPIALATQRHFGMKTWVTKYDIQVESPQGADYYLLSRAAGRFVSRFDSLKPVYPFSFFAKNFAKKVKPA